MIAPRPRGGDWLADEIASWRAQGIDTVVSLLTAVEETDLDLTEEPRQVIAQGLEYLSFPIPDRESPPDSNRALELVDKLDARLGAGKNILIHCRQGVGRSGLIAASLLVGRGSSPEAAFERLSQIRGVEIPETTGQKSWVTRNAEALMAMRS
jgi:protein-tyrosine phosphatase